MRVLVAGATGVVGRRLVPQLIKAGHDVVGTTRTAAKRSDLWNVGAEPMVVDGLDAAAVGEAVAKASPDVVVHQMTALSGISDLRHFDRTFAGTNALRSAGTDNLLAAARASGVRRFIAASYTPFALLAMPERTGAEALTLVWAGAGAGVVLKMCWPSAPRWLGLPLYLLLGYSAIWFAGTLVDGAGLTVVALLVIGGVLYNIGAVFYGLRWPNPWPTTFGHHEFFHAFTAAAALCHYFAAWGLII